MCLILSCSYDLSKIDAKAAPGVVYAQDLSERVPCYEALTGLWLGNQEEIAALADPLPNGAAYRGIPHVAKNERDVGPTRSSVAGTGSRSLIFRLANRESAARDDKGESKFL
jgi:hypothetical protein